jgi:asparagine synthase (glutamine-hydrolysing)
VRPSAADESGSAGPGREPPIDLKQGWGARLANAWRASVARSAPADAPLSLLFSGGLDSSLLAWSVRGRSAPVRLETIGVGDAPDLAAAESAARIIGLPWRPHRLTVKELGATARRFSGELAGLREPARSVALAVAAALERTDPRLVLCGQGADELFWGYAHFVGASETEGNARAGRDFERLVREDWPRALRMAAKLRRTLRSPYLDDEFVRAARALPPWVHSSRGGPTKPALRSLARGLGLPETLAARPKRALQYGSGVRRARTELDRTSTSARE